MARSDIASHSGLGLELLSTPPADFSPLRSPPPIEDKTLSAPVVGRQLLFGQLHRCLHCCPLLLSAVAEEMGNRQPKLSDEDLGLLLSKTSFTEAQIKQWYKGFMVSNLETVV